MTDIIIVCAGSVAVEVYYEIYAINEKAKSEGREEKYNVLGFLSDVENALEKYPYVESKILGNIKDWKPIGDEKYALGIATPKSKQKIVELLKSRGCKFETIISPDTIIRPHVKIGEGCFIAANNICAGAEIGNFVNIMGSMIGGESIIGDYSTTLGFTNIANGKLGKRVYVGSHAVVLDVEVGDDATVGVGSIVLRKVKAGTKVFGNPAIKYDF